MPSAGDQPATVTMKRIRLGKGRSHAALARLVANASAESSALISSSNSDGLQRLARRLGEAEMAEGVRGQQAAARRALHEALLDQIGLDDVLDRVARLGQRGRDRLDADRPAAEA